MKKKLFIGASTLMIALCLGVTADLQNESNNLSYLGLDNIEALTQGGENDLCPNGCQDDGSGCYCYGWYPSYKEAN